MSIQNYQKGFTVLEMIVVVGIIGVMLTVYVAGRDDGMGAAELKNTA